MSVLVGSSFLNRAASESTASASIADLPESIFQPCAHPNISSSTSARDLLVFLSVCLCRVFGGLEVLDTSVQGGDNLGFGDAEPSGWGDVAGTIGTDGSVFATHATNAQAERLADLLGVGVRATLAELWDLHEDGGSHACAEVGWARGDVAILLRVGKLQAFDGFDGVEGSLQPFEDAVNQGTLWLHAHDSQVIFFADPDDEALVFRLVAATAERPVRGNASVGEVRVGGHVLEHDVGLDEGLVLVISDEVWVARGERVVSAAVLLLEFDKGNLHLGFHGDSVVLVHGAREWKVCQVTANTDSHRHWWEAELGDVELTVGWEAGNTVQLPVSDVVLRSWDPVVVRDDSAEEWFKLVVIGWVHCVAALQILHYVTQKEGTAKGKGKGEN